MIKESFLRNYSLSKIYNQAEDEKNKLKVFYLRKVRKILKEKHEKERVTHREKISQENREERLKKRFKTKMKTEFCEPGPLNSLREAHGRSETQHQNQPKGKEKTDLSIIELKFQSECDDEPESILKNEKLKSLKMKIASSMLHSPKNSIDEARQVGSGIPRKNTINRAFVNRDFNQASEKHKSGCRNQPIIFHADVVNKQRQKTRFLNKIKENSELRSIMAKIESNIVSNL